MPLNTRVLRNGKVRKDIPWGGGDGDLFERNYVAEFLLNAFLTTGLKEGDPELVYSRDSDGTERRVGDLEPGKFLDLAMTGVYYIDTKSPLWREGRITCRDSHTYLEGTKYEVTFRTGDVLEMWRS